MSDKEVMFLYIRYLSNEVIAVDRVTVEVLENEVARVRYVVTRESAIEPNRYWIEIKYPTKTKVDIYCAEYAVPVLKYDPQLVLEKH